MCGVCGCGEPDASNRADGGAHTHENDRQTISLEHAILSKNQGFANANRRLFDERGVFVVDLLGSPGAGKTALLERLLADRRQTDHFAVIEGDLATDRDADRIRRAGAAVVQINTGSVCHLDAHMVGHALDGLDLVRGSTLVVENVGNLVCPALFDVGAHARIVALSITEGEDKPAKYPHIFATASAVVLTKLDLLPHLDIELERLRASLSEVCPDARIFETSAKTGQGMAELAAHLRARGASTAGAS